MATVGFLDIPHKADELGLALERMGMSELMRRPVLGRESVEPPWSTLEESDFFAVVDTGFHFADCRPPREWTPRVITSDSAIANSRLENGLGASTGLRGAIGGTFPFIDICGSDFFLSNPRRLLAMTDGTAGFVLSEMESKSCSLEEAIREAQWRGMTSGNINLNLHALIACERFALLASAAFGINLTAERILAEGFSQLESRDVAIASSLGYSIRLLCVVETKDDKYEAWVRPCLIPSTYVLAQVRGESEAAYMQYADGTSQIFVGPRTSFEVSLRGMLCDYRHLCEKDNFGLPDFKPSKLVPSNKQVSAYYLRLKFLNPVSTLAQVVNIFSSANIDLKYIMQPLPDSALNKTFAQLNKLTHNTSLKNDELILFTAPVANGILQDALEKIRSEVKLAAIKCCLKYES